MVSREQASDRRGDAGPMHVRPADTPPPPIPAAPHLHDITRRTGLDLERTQSAVHRLLHTELKILHEVSDTSGTDLGPVYELAPRI